MIANEPRAARGRVRAMTNECADVEQDDEDADDAVTIASSRSCRYGPDAPSIRGVRS